MSVLVTGGAGYIGSHITLELLQAGYDVVVVDSLVNSKRESLRRVEALAGKRLSFHQIDLRQRDVLDAVFKSVSIQAVIHLAGLKAPGESVETPLRYYHNNVVATLVLCQVMEQNDVRDIVFSSSATVYGDPPTVPIREHFPLGPTNPYGHSKLMVEQILRDLQRARPAWNAVLLRYFNPVGAHPSGRIGEDPRGIPNNLMPYIAQVAVGRLSELRVFGDDYPTPDGTGIRDYIHVVDLALGHLAAVEQLQSDPGLAVYNLGTGRGYSVLEVVAAFEEVSGREIPYRVVGRRPGDIAVCYADPSRAAVELGWTSRRDIADMCADTWRWQSGNPDGYRGEEDDKAEP